MAPEEGVTVPVWGQVGGLHGGGGALIAGCLPTGYERPRQREPSGMSRELSWWELPGGCGQCERGVLETLFTEGQYMSRKVLISRAWLSESSQAPYACEAGHRQPLGPPRPCASPGLFLLCPQQEPWPRLGQGCVWFRSSHKWNHQCTLLCVSVFFSWS